MTVLANTRYQTVPYVLTNGSKTSVYTCPTGVWSDIINVNVCASAGSAGTITLIFYNASDTVEYTLTYQDTVPAGGSLDVPFYPLHMEPGDILKATGAADQHLIITMIEQGRGA